MTDYPNTMNDAVKAWAEVLAGASTHPQNAYGVELGRIASLAPAMIWAAAPHASSAEREQMKAAFIAAIVEGAKQRMAEWARDDKDQEKK